MSLESWIATSVVLLSIGLMAFTRLAADLVLVAAVALLLLIGILSPGDALAGFANEGMITVGVLYVVVAGLRETGAVTTLGQNLFGRPRSLLEAQARMMLPVAALSAFLNNTPLVAMMIPAVNSWAKKYRVPVSKLMIPLSYAAILGGTCSLIGTSTNLVVNGLVLSETDLPGLGMFTIARIGLPSAVLGLLYLLVLGRWLLPERGAAVSSLDDLRRYSVELEVEGGGPLVGRSIEQAGLRNLHGAYLAEIERDGRLLPAVAPEETLYGGDLLRFVGVVEAMVELRTIRGLVPASDQVGKLRAPPERRRLIEAVVSERCPLVGKSIREGGFRTFYNAVVIAVARGGERVQRKIGDIVLRPGDTLLLEAQPGFVARQRNSPDFYLVSMLENSNPPRHDRAGVALAILVVMVALVATGLLSMLKAALLAAGLMLAGRCLSADAARRSVDWQVLVVIAASFGLGRALEVTGAAETIASGLTALAGGSPWLALAAIYGTTMLFTEVITNNGAAVLVFPIAYAASQALGVDFMPFVIAIMMAASASFATPIGYQTNLMVFGPGGYRFGDYLRVGVPLNLLMWALSAGLIPLLWPF